MITVPSDYTTGETKIPNAVSKNAGEVLNGDLQACIDKYERELLLKLLGEDQYEALKLEIVKNPFVADAVPIAPQAWQDLVNGTGDWIGLKKVCRNYVYCNYLRSIEIRVTTTGAGKSKSKASFIADYNQKIVDRFNEFVDWVASMEDYYEEEDTFDRPDDFPYYVYVNQLGL